MCSTGSGREYGSVGMLWEWDEMGKGSGCRGAEYRQNRYREWGHQTVGASIGTLRDIVYGVDAIMGCRPIGLTKRTEYRTAR
jgi:hypothetical protein